MTNCVLLRKEAAFCLDGLLGKYFPTKNAQIGYDILAAIMEGAVEDDLYHSFITWPSILYYPKERREEIARLGESELLNNEVIIRRIRSVIKYSWDHEGMDERRETLGTFYPVKPEPKAFVYGLLAYMMAKADFDDESANDARIRKTLFKCVKPSEVKSSGDLSVLVALTDYMQRYYCDNQPLSLRKYLRTYSTSVYPEKISKFLNKIDWGNRLGIGLDIHAHPQKFVDTWLALLHAED